MKRPAQYARFNNSIKPKPLDITSFASRLNPITGEIPKTNDQSTRQRTIQLSVGGSGAAHFEKIRFRSFKIK